jgi:hypothetical protein
MTPRRFITLLLATAFFAGVVAGAIYLGILIGYHLASEDGRMRVPSLSVPTTESNYR